MKDKGSTGKIMLFAIQQLLKSFRMIKIVLCKRKYANEGSTVSATTFISITPWIWCWSQSLNGLIWIYQFEQHWGEQYLIRLFQRQSIVVPSLSEPLTLWRRWNEINTCELQRTVPTCHAHPALAVIILVTIIITKEERVSWLYREFPK